MHSIHVNSIQQGDKIVVVSPYGGSSVSFGATELVSKTKVQILAATVWEVQLLQCGDDACVRHR